MLVLKNSYLKTLISLVEPNATDRDEAKKLGSVKWKTGLERLNFSFCYLDKNQGSSLHAVGTKMSLEQWEQKFLKAAGEGLETLNNFYRYVDQTILDPVGQVLVDDYALFLNEILTTQAAKNHYEDKVSKEGLMFKNEHYLYFIFDKDGKLKITVQSTVYFTMGLGEKQRNYGPKTVSCFDWVWDEEGFIKFGNLRFEEDPLKLLTDIVGEEHPDSNAVFEGAIRTIIKERLEKKERLGKLLTFLLFLLAILVGVGFPFLPFMSAAALGIFQAYYIAQIFVGISLILAITTITKILSDLGEKNRVLAVCELSFGIALIAVPVVPYALSVASMLSVFSLDSVTSGYVAWCCLSYLLIPLAMVIAYKLLTVVIDKVPKVVENLTIPVTLQQGRSLRGNSVFNSNNLTQPRSEAVDNSLDLGDRDEDISASQNSSASYG